MTLNPCVRLTINRSQERQKSSLKIILFNRLQGLIVTGVDKSLSSRSLTALALPALCGIGWRCRNRCSL